MATRTPGLQGRSEHHRNWGNFSAESLLPNAPGAPLATAQFALEAGDVAFVTGIGFCYCLDAGTAAGGDAVWQRLDSRVFRAAGFTVNDHWEGTPGQLAGSTTMTASVWVRHRTLLTAPTESFYFGTYRRFGGNGWAIGIGSSRPIFIITDGGGAVTDTSFSGMGWQGNGLAGSTADTRDFGALTDSIHTLVYNEPDFSVYINGTLVRTIGGLTGFTASGIAPILGGIRDNAGNPVQPTLGAIAGAAFTNAAGFTEAQVLDHVMRSFEANRMADGGAGFQNLWTLDGQLSAPNPLVDQIGAVNLARVGTPSIERTPARWL